jgi:uncharacterized protein (TIGR02145 family)
MKKFLHSFWVLACILCIVFYTPQQAHSSASGAPVGHTGSPGDGGSTCYSCHSGPSPSDFDSYGISFDDGGETDVYPNTVHDIQISLFSQGASKFGFQMRAEDSAGNSVGEILLTEPFSTQLDGEYITHTSSGTAFINNAIWTCLWLSPIDFEGEVTFYTAGIMSDNSGTNGGDKLTSNNITINVVSFESVLGCTDPLATNYNSNANEDDGSCEYSPCTDLSIVITPSFNAEQLSWTLVNEQGNIVYAGGEFLTDETICLPYDNYTFNAYDLIGDGWSGGTYQISTFCNDNTLILANNNELSPDNGNWNTIELELESSETFTVEECTPCLGFSIDVETTYLSADNSSDGSATVLTTLGNSPFEYSWFSDIDGELMVDGNLANNLAAGVHTVLVEDSEGCTDEMDFLIDVEEEIFITGTGSFTEITTCNGVFYDTGGPDDFYQTNENTVIRICPEIEGTYAQILFTEFDVPPFWGSVFTIYDGMGSTSPVLTNIEDIQINTPITASLDNSSGCLTIQFTSSFFNGAGWEAYLSCHDYIILGCMDIDADNYSDAAEEDDGSCYYQPGCTDYTFVEYHTQGYIADFNDGSCLTPFVDDCTNETALNYNPDATLNLEQDPCIFDLDDWVCGMHYKDERDGNTYGSILIGENCWMTENLNYAYSETNTTPIPNGVATQLDEGFIYTGQDEYNSDVNGRYYTWAAAEAAVPYSWHLPRAQELESLFETFTATDHLIGEQSGLNNQMSGGVILPTGELQFMNQGNTTWLWSATEEDDGAASALTMITSSMNPTFDVMPKVFALSIRAVFGFPQGTILGCTDSDYIEYSEDANTDDGSCEIVAIEGCTDETALNFSEIATIDDASCIPYIEGCMDDLYIEFDEDATVEDGTCDVIAILGCTDVAAQNYDELANLDDDSCIAHVLGCTDVNYAEFDETATQDDGSCTTTAILGCTDEDSFNYNSIANLDDDSCLPYLSGCTDENYVEFNGMANVDDGSCSVPVILGCTIDYALNYTEDANTDDGSCEVEGCTNVMFVEYDVNANIDNGSCSIFAILGCMDDMYLEFFPPANMDDESCMTLIVEGCMNPVYIEYSADANVDNGTCQNLAVIGCTDENFLEFNPEAVVDNNSCLTPAILGCIDSNYIEYSEDVNLDNGSCSVLKVDGCTDSNFIEYDPLANFDDGSCTYIVFLGCTDENYLEYNPNANEDNGTCITVVIFGCTDILAYNFNPNANTDDSSCVPVVIGCLDSNFVEYNSFANTEDQDLCITLVILGCTDEDAINYNPNANTDNGLCYMYLVEIATEGIANGGMLFTPTILGLGNEYELFWTFDNGTNSTEQTPLVFFESNGIYEIILVVSNGGIEVTTSIFVDILNAPGIGIEEVSNQKNVVEIIYFDVMGRRVLSNNLMPNYIYIKNVMYDDGSVQHIKMLTH